MTGMVIKSLRLNDNENLEFKIKILSYNESRYLLAILTNVRKHLQLIVGASLLKNNAGYIHIHIAEQL